MGLVLRRLPAMLATLLIVSFLTFLLTSLLPGDPAIQILGADNANDPDSVEVVREELRLDDPLLVRYGAWLGDVARGDLGRSFRTDQQVADAILERLPVTLEVGGLAVLIALLVAIPLGTLSAFRAGGRADRVVTGASFGLLALPPFMVAILLILVFAVTLGWLPATGWVRFTADPIDNLRHAILPALSLAVGEMAVYTRLLRADMITTLQQDSITMARAKGIPTSRILFRHALRPSSFSLMTVVGLQVATIIGGAVIIETLFALPGVGRLLVDSILQRDLIMVQGCALVIAIAFVVINFIVDLLYTVLDPRIRYGSAATT
ncbi:MAG TPA: ABC transporter permease [Acidimicrobiales bacterium]|nr:ABC transporter permease [Acidimicrobiales bacterium]